MPELPEVETVRRILNEIVKGKTIASIDVYRGKNLFPSPEVFVSSLVNETFLDVSRVGKYLVFHLTDNKAIISHLRMEGKYFEGHASDSYFKHDIMRFVFSDGSSLRYNDVRTFGTLTYRKEENLFNEKPLNTIGKEPFDISLSEFDSLLKKKKGSIKEALLDQTLVSGIGNIYDCEILFASKISPFRLANRLTEEEEKRILDNAKTILAKAIEEGGSTIKSYHPKEGVSGLFQNELKVYGKEKEHCSVCHFPIKRTLQGGRSTYYCTNCQKEHPLIIGVTGAIACGKSEVSRYLENKGYLHLDADKIVKELYEEPKIMEGIARIFGDEVINDGILDRNFMRNEIVKNSALKKKLERYIWPKVFSTIKKTIRQNKDRKILLDVPLLLGSPLEAMCDYIIDIDASIATQTERLRKRGKDPEESLKMNASFPRELAKKKADILLDGNGDVFALRKQLDEYPYL